MIFGRLVNGRLTDIASRESFFPEDVPLASMPVGYGPFAYDAVNQVAAPLDSMALTPDEKAGRRGIPPLALAALLVLASKSSTPAQKLKAQGIIDNLAGQVLDLLA